jgi:uncharacterized membrane protein YkoI
MRRVMFATIVVSTFIAAPAMAQAADKDKADSENKVAIRDVPAAVQQAIKEYSRGSTLRGLTKENEGGKTVYEAELRVNGHSKDITFDGQGQVVSLEEETALEQIPEAARRAIQKAAGKAKIIMVEMVTEGGNTAYEAQLKEGRRRSEVKVDASGRTVK